MARRSEKQLSDALQQEEQETDPMYAYEKTLRSSGNYRIYNADRSDTDLDQYSKAVLKPRRKWGFWVLLLLAAALLWYLYSQGVLPW